MSDDDTQPDTPPADEADKDEATKDGAAPEEGAEAEKDEKKSRIIESAKAAFNESFGKTTFERLQIWKWPTNSLLFIKNFFTELTAVKEEEAEVKDETESAVADAVEAGDPADVAENLTAQVSEESHFEPDQQEAVCQMTEDTLEAAKATGQSSRVIKLIARVQEDTEKGNKTPKAVTEEQIRLVFSMGMFTLLRLKDRFKTKEAMTAFLEKVKAAGSQSAKVAKLSKYLALNFRKMFKISEDRIPTLLDVDSLGNMARFAALKLGGGDKIKGALDIILPDLFPKSVEKKGLAQIRDFFKRMVAQKKYPDPPMIAELAFLLDENDLRDCAKRMGGAKVISLASVRETEARKAKTKKEKEAVAAKDKDKKAEKIPEDPVVAAAEKAKEEADEEEKEDKRRKLLAA